MTTEGCYLTLRLKTLKISTKMTKRCAFCLFCYLHRPALFIVHTYCDLDIFGGLLFPAVKLSLKQGYINIISDISWKKKKKNRPFVECPEN